METCPWGGRGRGVINCEHFTKQSANVLKSDMNRNTAISDVYLS